MSEFTKNLDDLLYLSSQKVCLTTFLRKNFKQDIHYIIINKDKQIKKHGGHLKKIYMLTETASNLLKNTFNLRNKYIVDVSDSVKSFNLCMCIENQTIGFIENSYKEIFKMKRQYIIGKYRLDLYFIENKLAIECDENNHDDRDPLYEKEREDYIKFLGNKIIRYDPNVKNFDMSNILREINKILYAK